MSHPPGTPRLPQLTSLGAGAAVTCRKRTYFCRGMVRKAVATLTDSKVAMAACWNSPSFD